MLAPVVLFVFSRPDHTRQTLKALAENILADRTDLIVYSDGARYLAEEGNVQAVRAIFRSVSGFRSVTLIERERNYGLAQNIIDGVTTVCGRHGQVIVLEDDLVTSPYFLTYMNDALDLYRKDDRVACIHGYTYPVKQPFTEAFFLPGADCWGWATWQRGWDCFNADGTALLKELKRRRLLRAFDFNGAYPYSKMLREQIAGKNDSWAVRWYASAFLAGKLTLYPGPSLVQNIGMDNTGTHCGISSVYDVALTERRVDLSKVVVEPSSRAFNKFEAFFRTSRPSLLSRVVQRVLKLIR